MPDSLRNVIDKLYRPPKNGRQVYALSRRDAEKLPLVSGVAVISITAPEKEAASLADFSNLLRLSFADVDFNDKNLGRRAKEKIAHAFKDADAERIYTFIDALPLDIHTVIVHCEGGYSRSCAVAMFLHQQLGYAANTSTLLEYNPSVLQKLVTNYKKHSQP